MSEVSVIITAYNCESYIHEAVKSVIEQTASNIEIIVVDDGSTDNTPAILISLASKDMRIQVYKQVNSGRPSIARNNGLKRARGKFICFLDGDDLYHPEKIERSLKVFAGYPKIDVVFHDVKMLAHDGAEIEGTYLETAGFQQKASDFLDHRGGRIYVSNPHFYNFMSTTITGLHTSSVMVRKERLDVESIWFPEDMFIGEDIDLWFRLVKGSSVGYVDEPLSYYRSHDNSVTKNIESYLIGSISAHTKNFYRAKDILSKREKIIYRNRIATQYFYLGYNYFNEGNIVSARKAYLHSMKWLFLNKTLISYLKSFCPNKIVLKYRKMT